VKRALITGIAGQDGSYLAEWLLDQGYRVAGFARHETWMRSPWAARFGSRVEMHFGDMAEGIDIAAAVAEVQPDEVYNLASQSRPSESWSRAAETLLVNGTGALRLFEAVRHTRPVARVYNASSSEMFGRASQVPQDENTPFSPLSPYAAAKIYAHQMACIYRERYGLHVCSGILFNHESERRPLHYVSQKIAYGAACASLGIDTSPDLNEIGQPIVCEGRLALGDLNVARDWGHARDFVRAMWLMLQRDRPEDFVIGTGRLHSLEHMCEVAYGFVGLPWQAHVISEAALTRPIEARQTLADPRKAREVLGWQPTVTFEEMVLGMVDAQRQRLQARLSGRSSDII